MEPDRAYRFSRNQLSFSVLKASAIIVASGSGSRMGFDKLLAPLAGKPLLEWSIEAFINCPEITEVVVACPEQRFEKLGLKHDHSTRLIRIDGGEMRHQSVMRGLDACASDVDFLAVHDGARPLITPEAISLCLAAAATYRAAALAHPITETLKRVDDEQCAVEAVDRTRLWAMETPQCFEATLLKTAYAEVSRQGLSVTDEVSAVALLGVRAKLVPHDSSNLKITYPTDLEIAARFLCP